MSKLGLLLAGVFFALTILVISAEGIFGSSTATIALGLPWSLVGMLVPANSAPSPVLVYALVLVPIALNAALAYGIGYGISSFYKGFVKG